MSSKSKSTSFSENQPWQPAQSGLRDILTKAQSLGGNTNLFTPVQGATTRQALDLTKQIANQGSAALDPLQRVVSGSTDGFGTGIDQLIATARGDNLGAVNPHLASALETASRNTANVTNQQFAASGRYGSANHAGTISDRVGAIQTQALVDNYNKERDAQLNAANVLNAGGYQGASLAPEIDNARLFTPQMLGQVGAAEDAFAQAQKQAPLAGAEWQAGLTVPIAGLGGTQNSTATSKTSNPLGTAIGAGMTGLGLLGGGGGMGLLGGMGAGQSMLGNIFSGAPLNYGASWSPWVQRA